MQPKLFKSDYIGTVFRIRILHIFPDLDAKALFSIKVDVDVDTVPVCKEVILTFLNQNVFQKSLLPIAGRQHTSLAFGCVCFSSAQTSTELCNHVALCSILNSHILSEMYENICVTLDARDCFKSFIGEKSILKRFLYVYRKNRYALRLIERFVIAIGQHTQ